VAHQVRWLCQQPGHQGRVGVEILTRTDPLAAPVAGPVDNLQREAVSQLQLLAPAQLAGQHAAVQQHYPRSRSATSSAWPGRTQRHNYESRDYLHRQEIPEK
jgi:hypothetical protein